MDIDTMMGCHGPVVNGAKAVNDILNVYHDGIKYVHDQTIRGMEHLKSLDDIIDGAKLPKTLAEHPWLKEIFSNTTCFSSLLQRALGKNTKSKHMELLNGQVEVFTILILVGLMDKQRI